VSNDIRPGTVWLTGLSASGKTTLGARLKTELERAGVERVLLLDGEEARKSIGRRYGYSTEERSAWALEIARLAAEWNSRGYVVIVAAITHVSKTRAAIRAMLGRYFEVYLRCPVEVCAGRDYKGHYSKALAGEYENFIGVTEPYQVSSQHDLVLDTDKLDVDACAALLADHTSKFLKE